MLTDSDHKAGFKTQCALLARIFELIETGKVQAPLGEGVSSNQLFIRQYTANLLKTAFLHVESAYIEQFVNSLCTNASDLNAYR